MISAETPYMFVKACEIFIIDLTYRSLGYTLQSKNKSLQVSVGIGQKSDVSACIYNTEIFDFLMDLIPKSYLRRLKKKPGKVMFSVFPIN